MSVKVCAVILAAGSGSRMQSELTKQQMTILGKTVLCHTLSAFNNSSDIDSIVVVCREDEMDFVNSQISNMDKVVSVVIGGKTRAESAFFGFSQIPSDSDFVAIHDSARCLITEKMISAVVEDAKKYGAATASRIVTDTVKKVDENGFISATENRNILRLMQTPQVFSTAIYRQAVSGVDLTDPALTDDNMLVERLGVKIFCTELPADNIKITYSEDVSLAEHILKGRVNNE